MNSSNSEDHGTTNPKVLIFAAYFDPAIKAGGPVRVLSNLVDELADRYSVRVLTADRDSGDDAPFPDIGSQVVTRGQATVAYLNLWSVRDFVRMIRYVYGRYDLILLNSLWNLRFTLLPIALSTMGVIRGPVLLMPRGELEVGALALGRRRKRWAGLILWPFFRARVTAFGVTSDSEEENVRKQFGAVDVVRTRTDHPDVLWPCEAADRRHGCGLRLLFLGRIHPTKGLLELLSGCRETTRRISLTIAGPVGDASYWQECEALMGELPESVHIMYVGAVDREAVRDLLCTHDLLAMLTAGENFGHVIAEALQSGLPVLVTPDTPWTAAVSGGGGVLVRDRADASEVAAVLDRWGRMSRDELSDSRLHARGAWDALNIHASPSVVEEFFRYRR